MNPSEESLKATASMIQELIGMTQILIDVLRPKLGKRISEPLRGLGKLFHGNPLKDKIPSVPLFDQWTSQNKVIHSGLLQQKDRDFVSADLVLDWLKFVSRILAPPGDADESQTSAAIVDHALQNGSKNSSNKDEKITQPKSPCSFSKTSHEVKTYMKKHELSIQSASMEKTSSISSAPILSPIKSPKKHNFPITSPHTSTSNIHSEDKFPPQSPKSSSHSVISQCPTSPLAQRNTFKEDNKTISGPSPSSDQPSDDNLIPPQPPELPPPIPPSDEDEDEDAEGDDESTEDGAQPPPPPPLPPAQLPEGSAFESESPENALEDEFGTPPQLPSLPQSERGSPLSTPSQPHHTTDHHSSTSNPRNSFLPSSPLHSSSSSSSSSSFSSTDRLSSRTDQKEASSSSHSSGFREGVNASGVQRQLPPVDTASFKPSRIALLKTSFQTFG